MNLTLDIQSLGLSEDSVILSIEAKVYDHRWNKIKHEYWNCDIQSQLLDRKIEPKSLEAWKNRREDFQKKLHLAAPIKECLRELHQFITGIKDPFTAFSICPLVDTIILEHAGTQHGIKFDIPPPFTLKGRELFNYKDQF